jgi:glycosyltransferase involved in cell wall biosynthesis
LRGVIVLKYLKFLWCYRKGCFTHALANVTRSKVRRESKKKLLAMYRLSMYQSVMKSSLNPSCWQSCLAKIVSLAVCGEIEAAQRWVAFFKHSYTQDHQKKALINGLAPLMPHVALSLINEFSAASPALHVALLLRNGHFLEARSLLALLSASIIKNEPELLLLRTNAEGGSSEIQLQRLNAYLAAFMLPSLRLNDPLLAPSPLNIGTAEEPDSEHCSGPLISVLMTTFNTGRRAEVAVTSLLAQRYQSLEVIIVDDASSDDTPDRLEKLALRDCRIKLFRLPRNVGTYAAKRIGLLKARGEFVTCHDSDDWSHPDKLSRQLAPMLTDPEIVCTISNWVRMQDDGLFYARSVYPLVRLNPSSPLFRREKVLREAGSWDCVRTGADSEFLARLRLIFGVDAIKKINEPLTIGSHRDDSLMTSVSTGYTQAGISPQRQEYWEAWSQWHIDCLAAGNKPYIDGTKPFTVIRPFAVPASLQVDPDALADCQRILQHH